MPTDLRTTDLDPTPCPACGAQLERATGTTLPQPGEVTMCAHCFVYLTFTPRLRLRRLSDRAWLALPPEQRRLLTRLRDRLRARLL